MQVRPGGEPADLAGDRVAVHRGRLRRRPQPHQPVGHPLDRIGRDQRAVDRPDRRADHHVGAVAGAQQRAQHADLDRAQHTAATEHVRHRAADHDSTLAGRRLRLARRTGHVMICGVSVGRRTVLGAGLAGVAARLSGCGDPTRPVWTEPPALPGAAPAPSATAAGRAVTAQSAAAGSELTGAVRAVLVKYLKPTPDNPRHPGYAGAVALLTVNGTTVVHTAVGDAVRYKAGPVELPPGQR